MLDRPYPGGPEIPRLAEEARKRTLPHATKLPRPMMHSNDLDFSFAGLKTAVLYYIRDHFEGDAGKIGEIQKADIAREFEDAVTDVLLRACEKARKNS